MTDSLRAPSSILVEVELPDPTPLSPNLVELLGSLRVVLVGWYAVPEQTSPAQARDQFEGQARSDLQAIAAPFEKAGADVEMHLVFTGDEFDTISRISSEEDCDAVLIPAGMDTLERILVPLRGLRNAHRIAAIVADLVQDGTTDVTILHVLEEGETEASAREQVLGPVADRMTGEGIDAGLLRLESVSADDPADMIVERSKEYDAVVIGETKPSVREILFGTVPEIIAKTADVPILVVRHAEEGVDVAERATQAK